MKSRLLATIAIVACLTSSAWSQGYSIDAKKFRKITDEEINSVVDDIVGGKFKDYSGPLINRPKPSRVTNFFWRLSHLDDMIFGVTIGLGSWIFGIHKKGFKEFRKVADGKKLDGIFVKRAPLKNKYVIFSDHHLLGHAKKHDYFKTWEQGATHSNKIESLDIYKKALTNYYEEGFTLVENGDVEDLVTIEPSYNVMVLDQLFDLLGLPLGEIFDEKFESKQKQLQLLDIFYNYQDLYEMVADTFVKNDRFIKVIGNHDVILKKEKFLKMIQKIYRKDIQVYDYLLIEPQDEKGKPAGYPAYIVAHGHQVDPWTTPSVAKLVGESFTQSEAWFGNGADRIWPKSEGGSGGWKTSMTAESGFDNRLAIAPSMKTEKGMTTKFRHMGEMNLKKHMQRAFKDAPSIPTLVFGHTHEPKIDAVNRKKQQFTGYLNTGATGHYEQLIWCIEIADGKPALYAWYVDDNGKIVKQLMKGTENGRLIPESQTIVD